MAALLRFPIDPFHIKKTHLVLRAFDGTRKEVIGNIELPDKSQIYMRFTLIYLVFCIIYHLFWAFLLVFYLIGDVQVEGSKNKQKGVERGNSGQSKRACRGMVLSCRSMRCTPVKNQRSACRSMPKLCRSMPRRFKNKILKICRSMPKPCRDMATFISPVIFDN